MMKQIKKVFDGLLPVVGSYEDTVLQLRLMLENNVIELQNKLRKKSKASLKTTEACVKHNILTTNADKLLNKIRDTSTKETTEETEETSNKSSKSPKL